MSWIFPVFFSVVIVCAVVYGVLELRSRLQKREQTSCVLETRMREKFPVLTLLGRRDRVDYILVFRTEQERDIRLTVSKDVYKSIPKQVPGKLTWQGERLLSFAWEDTVITPASARALQERKDREREAQERDGGVKKN